MDKIEGDNTPDETRDMISSEKLRLALLRFSHRILTPRSAEGVSQDKGIGNAYLLARRGRDLTRTDAARIINISDFGRDELALFEQGLISIQDIPHEVTARLVDVLPEVLNSQPFEAIRSDKNFKFLLGGN